MFTAAQSILAANNPGRPDPGEVLVADDLVWPDRPSIGCPASPLLAGELARRGVRAARGHLHVETADTVALRAVFPAAEHEAGLGVAVTGSPALTEQVCGAMAACLAVAGTARTVLLAAPRSFCAGVERAVEIVERLLARRGGLIFVRKQIVHNAHVVADLEDRGAVFVDELDQVPRGATVVFSAHGVSPAVRAHAARRRLDVIDATCPLVTKVHAEAKRFAAAGHTVLLIGHAGHEEVEGTLGEAPERTVLVQSAEDARTVRVPDPRRVSYLTQTTLSVDETAEVLDVLRRRFPALRGPASDDICYATTNRQDALRGIAAAADLVLVVGSRNSSNSMRLVELARKQGTPAQLIDDAAGIRTDWLAGVRTIGLTAGASAPPRLVDDVIAALGGLGPLTVEERETTRETVHFTLPRKVRR
ncbi:4-hydroxy-3-methylbut-2-enyl diphosphate reductase [Amycolatopsis sp. K13G38]|uniref:4-hydroxy-3-methylbut-2-enyl diphosphate reductase n=1 Tax=Amycolatopsis acididurans TaxID=2724524 RepID=A0ABX1JBI0_9PSEU|nr:4-hydroxy-3-methylbut-2-enyl diphosphate reductase [Amycolatopsis acididurans]NKQ57150.1 4-hydroxy-3-methylbut-2-enyl diphosphate reductase [Amycolatopsis acididurans]